MKFLILTQFFPPETGAAQTRLAEMVSSLSTEGHDVEVLTAMPNYPIGRIFANYSGRFYMKDDYKGIPVHRFWLYASQGRSWLRLFNYLSFMLTCCFGIFLCKRPDYIFINSGPLFLAIPGRLLSILWRRPIIFNVADLWPRSVEKLEATGAKHLLKLAFSLEKWAYKNAKYLTAVTEGIQQSLIEEKKIDKKRLLFMPNGVNVELYSPRKTPQKKIDLRKKFKLEDKFVFIYPGNHGFAHALDNILNAALLIQNTAEQTPEFKSIHIIFVGGGSDKPRLLQIKEKNQLTNVSFLDSVSQEELVDYLDMADVGLINIRNTHLAQETRPAKMFPIMAMAKPIVFAGYSEGSAIIELTRGGLVVEAENPEQLKKSMLDLFKGQHDLAQMGLNNREYVMQHLQFKNIVTQWLAELKKKEN